MKTGYETIDRANGHYTIITADSHAGGSHAAYREYLDPRVPRGVRRLAGQVQEPVQGPRGHAAPPQLGQRDAQRPAGGRRRRRRGHLPEHHPPLLPELRPLRRASQPEEYEHRLAGIRAHNRWLVDFCAEFPERRAGIGQIFLNDIDDAIADVHWIKEHGLRGGILLPNVPPDVKWVRPLYDPEYDRLWEVIEDLEMPVNVHGGTGVPDYGDYPFADALLHQRGDVLLPAALRAFRPRRRLRTLPAARSSPSPRPVLLGAAAAQAISTPPSTGSARPARPGRSATATSTSSTTWPASTSPRTCWMGVSQPRPADVAVREQIGADRFMWGSDYPHDEGTYPFTRETLRQVMRGIRPGREAADPGGELRQALRLRSGQAGPAGGQVRPHRRGAGGAPRPATRQRERRAPQVGVGPRGTERVRRPAPLRDGWLGGSCGVGVIRGPVVRR